MQASLNCISSVIEYIIMEAQQNISIHTYSMTLPYNGISIIYFKSVYSETLGLEVYSYTHHLPEFFLYHISVDIMFQSSCFNDIMLQLQLLEFMSRFRQLTTDNWQFLENCLINVHCKLWIEIHIFV